MKTNKTICILQPGYLPWLGFFDQLDQSDEFVLFDTVQYDKHGWRNRNKIKTRQGEQWLTVPVLTKGEAYQTIAGVRINNDDKWQKKHVSSIKQNYSRSKYYEIAQNVCSVIQTPQFLLKDLDYAIIKCLMKHLGINKHLWFSSSLDSAGGKNGRLIKIIKQLGGDKFIEGSAGSSYIDLQMFKDAGISVSFQEYQHPVYDQLYGDFVPYLSVLDLLCNCGPKSLEIIRSGRCRKNQC